MPLADKEKTRAQKIPVKEVSPKFLPLWICLGLAVGTLILFWPVRHFEFIHYDDQDYVTENSFVQHGLNRASIEWAFTQTHSSNWHPLTWMSHTLDWQLFGNNPGAHHFVSLLLHVLNTLLLFLVAKRMTGAIWRSAFLAALFAWHPLHVESVAWISERKDVLSTFFWMLTIWAYVRYAEGKRKKLKVQNPQSENERSTFNAQHSTFKAGDVRCSMFNVECSMFYSLALIFFALGLMSKPMVVTLPFVLLLLDVWPLKRMSKLQSPKSRVEGANTEQHWPLDFRLWTSLLLEKIPFFALTIGSCVVTFLAQKNAGAMRSLIDIPIGLRVENALVSCVVYIRKMFWPDDLAIFYPHAKTIPLWEFGGAALLIVALTVAVMTQIKKRPYLAVGWFWYLGTLVPVIGLVQVGVQALADRYTYLPMIGLFIALIWGGSELLAKWPQRRFALSALTAFIVLGACVTASWRYVQLWQNSKTLFTQALAVTTDNFIAHHSLGTALANDDTPAAIAEAEKHFREAIRIYPRFAEAEQNLGNILLNRKQFDEALVHYQNAIRIRPNYENAYNNLGLLYAQQQKWPEAITNFEKAISLDPTKGGTHFNLGSAYLKQGNSDQALAHYQTAVQLDPTMAEAHFQASLILTAQKKTADAIAHLQQAARLRPDWVDVLGRLAWIWATDPNKDLRNGPGAVQLAEHAATRTHEKDIRVLSVLAAAYAESGRFAEAIQTAEKAKQLALATGAKEQSASIAKKIEFYRANRPYHQE